MKKLLISTALVSSVLTGVAFSQTSITGEMRLGYKTHYDAVDAITSARGFGNEMQLNIQNKGKTNFGWDYASGFSIEVDSNSAASSFDENVFIDFINPSSGTTLSVSRDHIQRSDSARNASVAFGYDAPDVMEGAVSAANESFVLIRATPGTNAGQSFGFAIIQDVAKLGKVSYSYIPNTTQPGNSEGMQASGESAYEVGFTGSLGVAGLNTYAFEGKKEKGDTTALGSDGKKPQQKNFGVSYNTGPITVGYEYTKHVGFNSSLGFNDNNEIKEQGYGIAYAVNKDLSLQLHHTKAKQDANSVDANTKDAKVTSIQAGYNLGPVALIVGAGKYDGILGGEDEDGKTIFTRLLTAF